MAGQSVTILAGKREMTIDTGLPLGKLVALADELLTDWAREHGGLPDYIHGRWGGQSPGPDRCFPRPAPAPPGEV